MFIGRHYQAGDILIPEVTRLRLCRLLELLGEGSDDVLSVTVYGLYVDIEKATRGPSGGWQVEGDKIVSHTKRRWIRLFNKELWKIWY